MRNAVGNTREKATKGDFVSAILHIENEGTVAKLLARHPKESRPATIIQPGTDELAPLHQSQRRKTEPADKWVQSWKSSKRRSSSAKKAADKLEALPAGYEYEVLDFGGMGIDGEDNMRIPGSQSAKVVKIKKLNPAPSERVHTTNVGRHTTNVKDEGVSTAYAENGGPVSEFPVREEKSRTSAIQIDTNEEIDEAKKMYAQNILEHRSEKTTSPSTPFTLNLADLQPFFSVYCLQTRALTSSHDISHAIAA